MPKKKRGRRKKFDSSSEEEEDTPPSSPSLSSNHKKLSFKEKQDQRKENATTKRKSKQKCRLCNQLGHIRRECPGIADGGSGESKYKTKGSTSRTGKNKHPPKGGKSRGQNKQHEEEQLFQFPVSFQQTQEEAQPEHHEGTPRPAAALEVPLFDSSSDVAATLHYIAKVRGKKVDAASEYGQLLSAQTTHNYAGVICPYIIKANASFWQLGGPKRLKKMDPRIYYVVGIAPNAAPSIVADLIHDVLADPCVVGLYAALDFEEKMASTESQIQRLTSMCGAATVHNVPLQVSIAGRPHAAVEVETTTPDTADTSDAATADPYMDAVRAFAACAVAHPHLSIHLSSWSGSCDNMNKLLTAFPGLMVGMNGCVSFAKALPLHACAYDVPLERLLLETGTPKCIPNTVTKMLGRNAINHSGLVPFVAEAIAMHKTTKTVTVAGMDVARASSVNCLRMYPRLASLMEEKNKKNKKNKKKKEVGVGAGAVQLLLVGSEIDTIMGKGVVLAIRQDGSVQVELQSWVLAYHCKVILYTQLGAGGSGSGSGSGSRSGN